MITASVVRIVFSEELSSTTDAVTPQPQGDSWLPPARFAEGRERPLLPQDQVLPITMKTPHAQGVTMETLLCSPLDPVPGFPGCVWHVSPAGKILGLEAVVTAGMTHNVRLLLGSSSLAFLALHVSPGGPQVVRTGKAAFLGGVVGAGTLTLGHSGGTELYSLPNTVFPNPRSLQSEVFFQPDMIRSMLSHVWWGRLMNWGP